MILLIALILSGTSGLSRNDVVGAIHNGNNMPGPGWQWQELTLLGGQRNPPNTGQQWLTTENQPVYYTFCPGQNDNSYGIENCPLIVPRATLPPCIADGGCESPTSFPRYICKKGLSCPDPNAEVVNGRCRCRDGYFAVEEDDSRERGRSRIEERCISRQPCNHVKKSMSILFIVDSSASIGERNWDSLTHFIRTGARLIPKSTRVGFIKYASNISYNKWMEPGWSRSEFEKRAPSKYDNGQTNTEEALKTAVSMFRKDDSRYQVAVLVTDGLPYTDEYADNKQEALAVTKAAAEKLRNQVIKLVALGYGQILHRDNGEEYLKRLVEDREDYFEFHRDACDLKDSHMSILLGKVCRRFV